MKIENFVKAEIIKRKYDELLNKSKEIKDALDFERTPKAENFEVFSFGINQIKLEFLDWKKMLIEAK